MKEKEELISLYNEIIEIMKKKAVCYNGIFLNYMQLNISSFKMLLFDCDNGRMHLTITNEISKKSELKPLFEAKDLPQCKAADLKQILKEIK